MCLNGWMMGPVWKVGEMSRLLPTRPHRPRQPPHLTPTECKSDQADQLIFLANLSSLFSFSQTCVLVLTANRILPHQATPHHIPKLNNRNHSYQNSTSRHWRQIRRLLDRPPYHHRTHSWRRQSHRRMNRSPRAIWQLLTRHEHRRTVRRQKTGMWHTVCKLLFKAFTLMYHFNWRWKRIV